MVKFDTGKLDKKDKSEDDQERTYKIKFKIGDQVVKEPFNLKEINVKTFSYELSEKYKLPYTKIKSVVETQVAAIKQHENKKFQKKIRLSLNEINYTELNNINNNDIVETDSAKNTDKNFKVTDTYVNNYNNSKFDKNDKRQNSSILNQDNRPATKKKTYLQTKTFRFHQEFEKIKNVGDKVYQKSLVELERRRKNAEKIKSEMDEKELKECKVRPVKSEYSTFLNFKLHFNLISADRRRIRQVKSSEKIANFKEESNIRLKSVNSFGSNTNINANTFRGINDDTNEDLKDFKELNNINSGEFSGPEFNKINSADLTFEENPDATTNKKTIDNNKNETVNNDNEKTNPRNKKKSVDEVNKISNRLFRDWEAKLLKRQKLQEEYLKETCTFQPTTLQSQSRANQSVDGEFKINPEEFYKRLKDWKEKRNEKLSSSVARSSEFNLTTGEKLYTPNANTRSNSTKGDFEFKFNEERLKKGIFERLFKDHEEKKEQKKEEEKKYMEQVKNSSSFLITDSNSKAITENNKNEMFEVIYKAINPSDERSITITEEYFSELAIDEKEKKQLKPLLKFFLDSKQGYTHREFIESAMIYYDKKMKYEDKMHVNEWYDKVKKAKSPKKIREDMMNMEIKKKFSFKPEISGTSLNVLQTSKKYSNTSFQDRIKDMIEKKKTFISSKQMERDLEIRKKCSFKPNTKDNNNLNLFAKKSTMIDPTAPENQIREKDSDQDSDDDHRIHTVTSQTKTEGTAEMGEMETELNVEM